jgi:hypothetical protein
MFGSVIMQQVNLCESKKKKNDDQKIHLPKNAESIWTTGLYTS